MSVIVADPYGAVTDPKMPFLAAALDPGQVRSHLIPRIARAGIGGDWPLREIRVARYKPGRRCLVEYLFARRSGDTDGITLIGKIQARGPDTTTYEITQALAGADFDADSDDGIAVPPPVAMVPEFQMWLQRKVPGQVATNLLAGPDGLALMARVAQAAHKLHGSGVIPHRLHGMTEELAILDDRLGKVGEMYPGWRRRVEKVLIACRRLGASITAPPARPIHRDFYPDQLLIDGSRLYVVDLDLYCLGDPALDIGNFLGHLTELALRQFGGAEALLKQETALVEHFVALAGSAVRQRVRAYADLTLVRHIFLSTQFPERRPFTEEILTLCEERLGIGPGARTASPAAAWLSP